MLRLLLRVGRVLACAAVLLTVAPHTMLAARTVLRVSVENSADHVQTQAVQEFGEELYRRSDGRIQLHHSGTLFRDQDVFAALSRGQVDMAVPGTWQVSRFLPEVAVFLLPHFFGRDAEFVHAYSDGALGRQLARQLEVTLDVMVPGRWFDLGPGHLYFQRQGVASHAELAGLTVRVAGGLGNELRIEALGADAVSVAWNELPQRLMGRQIDGILTTHETVRSGALWEYGIDHALEDYQYFPQYVPMIRRGFWERLSASEQRLLREVWEELVDKQREAAARAQVEARAVLLENGVRVHSVEAAQLEQTRERLLRSQDDMARRLGIPPGVMELLHAKP